MTPETLAKYRDLLDGLKSGSRTVERVTHEVGDFFDDGTMLVTACEWDYKIRCKTLLDVKFIAASPTMVRELLDEVERLRAIASGYKVAGSDDCSTCETGRVSYYHWNKKCISCAPEEYKIETSVNKIDKLQTQLEAQKKAIEWYDRIPCNESFHRLGGIDDCDPCKYKLEAKTILNEAGLG